MMAATLVELLQGPPVVVNVGVRAFGDSLRGTCEVIQVDWSPPAGGDARMAALLDDLL